jgi:hypothetical protein
VILAPGQRLRRRLAGLLALSVLTWFVVNLFQARGMLLQIVLAVATTLWLTRPISRFFIIPIGVWLAWHEIAAFLSVDTISSQLRLSNYSGVFHIVFTQPGSLFFGRSETNVFDAEAARLGLSEATTVGTNAIHNAFLSQLVGGGWVSFLLFSAVFWLMLRRAWREWRLNRDDPVWTILLTASVLTIFEMMVETGRAQVVGNWIVLGLVFAVTSRKGDRPRLVALSEPEPAEAK